MEGFCLRELLKRCAFLTMHSLAGFVNDDELLQEPLAQLGWSVDAVPWDQANVRWEKFDAVLIRSAWDYARRSAQFLTVLQAIDRSCTRLENPLPIVRWNMDKGYLLDLQKKGVPVVPTVGSQGIHEQQIRHLFDSLETDGIVLKPVIGANADRTHRLQRQSFQQSLTRLKNDFQDQAYLAQPFVEQIQSEGEFSLFYFAGAYSHAILKTPKPKDFRVQEEHGGIIQPVTPEPELLGCAGQALDALGQTLLYARVDLVRARQGFQLMELELIEPSLYLRMDSGAPERFAKAFDDWMNPQRARPATFGGCSTSS